MICRFCGVEKTLTKEHVISSWISKLRSFEGGVIVSRRIGDSGDANTFALKKIDIQVRIVCRKCNGGWMSRLENSTKAFLEPLLEGSSVALGSEEIKTLAHWCIKTAISAAHESGYGEILPPVTARQLANGETPTNVAAWVSRFRDDLTPNRAVRLLPRRLDCTAENIFVGSMYDFTAAIGPLVVKVVFVPDAIARGMKYLEFAEPKPLVPVWPIPVEELHWPPDFSYCEAELVALSFALPGTASPWPNVA